MHNVDELTAFSGYLHGLCWGVALQDALSGLALLSRLQLRTNPYTVALPKSALLLPCSCLLN
jgi:hypothetical protein